MPDKAIRFTNVSRYFGDVRAVDQGQPGDRGWGVLHHAGALRLGEDHLPAHDRRL